MAWFNHQLENHPSESPPDLHPNQAPLATGFVVALKGCATQATAPAPQNVGSGWSSQKTAENGVVVDFCGEGETWNYQFFFYFFLGGWGWGVVGVKGVFFRIVTCEDEIDIISCAYTILVPSKFV